MKIHKKIIATFLFIIISAGLFSSISKPTFSPERKNANYVIIKSALFNRPISKVNAAIVISNGEEIKQFKKLLLKNRRLNIHACGYDYVIQFWENSTLLIKDIPYNKECEEFISKTGEIKILMDTYIKEIETNPTHFIYNVKLAVGTRTERIEHIFQNSGIKFFFMENPLNRYPKIKFSLSQKVPIKNSRNMWEKEIKKNRINVSKKMELIIDSINGISRIVNQPKINFTKNSFGKGTIEHEGQVVINIKNAENLPKIKKVIENNNGMINNIKTPQFYFLQAFDTCDTIEIVKEKLNKYNAVKGIYTYPIRRLKKQ